MKQTQEYTRTYTKKKKTHTVVWKNVTVQKKEREGGAEEEVERIKDKGVECYQ